MMTDKRDTLQPKSTEEFEFYPLDYTKEDLQHLYNGLTALSTQYQKVGDELWRLKMFTEAKTVNKELGRVRTLRRRLSAGLESTVKHFRLIENKGE
jgi:hypothetical protein